MVNAGLFLIMVVLFAGGYRMFGKVDRFFKEQSENGNKKESAKIEKIQTDFPCTLSLRSL